MSREATIQEKYSHLQRTAWKDKYATTTLGNLTAEQFAKIEGAYAAQMAKESGQETPVGSTSDSNGLTGENVETPSADAGNGDTNIGKTEDQGAQADAGHDEAGHTHDFANSSANEEAIAHTGNDVAAEPQHDQKSGNVGDAV